MRKDQLGEFKTYKETYIDIVVVAVLIDTHLDSCLILDLKLLVQKG